MDPIDQGVLSYLEFYNCCCGVQDICHSIMDPTDQLLQVTKLLIYLLLTNQITDGQLNAPTS